LTLIEHESIPSSIAANFSQLHATRSFRENRQATQGKHHKKGNKKGDAISVPFLVCIALWQPYGARTVDNNSSMTRRRWIADTFTDTTASLIGAQAEHLARVLRAQSGTEADIVANGRVFHATIASVTLGEVLFHLQEEITADPALPITLLLAVFKFDRMEWAIEKATELGVATIVPIIARRTEKHLAQAADKRVERWRRLAHEAAKQSRRADLPLIEEPIALPARLTQATSSQCILLAEDERNTTLRQRIETALASAGSDLPDFELAIGPEGGWTPEEIALFAKHNWQSASLGPRILRAETAAIAAISIAAALL
jgi:16S rRNA (uracil1498-N3)-methyltransferase